MKDKQKGKIWSLTVNLLALSLIFNGLQPVFAFAQNNPTVSSVDSVQSSAISLSAPVENFAGNIVVDLQKTYSQEQQNPQNDLVQQTFKLDAQAQNAGAQIAVRSENTLAQETGAKILNSTTTAANTTQSIAVNSQSQVNEYSFIPGSPGEQAPALAASVQIGYENREQNVFRIQISTNISVAAQSGVAADLNRFEVLRC